MLLFLFLFLAAQVSAPFYEQSFYVPLSNSEKSLLQSTIAGQLAEIEALKKTLERQAPCIRELAEVKLQREEIRNWYVALCNLKQSLEVRLQETSASLQTEHDRNNELLRSEASSKAQVSQFQEIVASLQVENQNARTEHANVVLVNNQLNNELSGLKQFLGMQTIKFQATISANDQLQNELLGLRQVFGMQTTNLQCAFSVNKQLTDQFSCVAGEKQILMQKLAKQKIDIAEINQLVKRLKIQNYYEKQTIQNLKQELAVQKGKNVRLSIKKH